MGGAAVEIAPPPADVTAAPAGATAVIGTRARVARLVADTPGRLRMTAVGLCLSIVVLGIVSALDVDGRTAATERIRDESGPLLVASQELSSSYAEADTLATSTFLAGDVEDRAQRRQYEGTLARIADLLEQAARTAGDDPETHALLVQLQSRSMTYAGLIERARVLRDTDRTAALGVLADAATFRRERLDPTVDSLGERAQTRLDADDSDASGSGAVLAGSLVVMLAAVLTCQWFLARRFRRLFNLPMLAGTCLLVVGTAWSVTATSRHADDLRSATTIRLETVRALASTRAVAYELQGRLSRALIAGEGAPPELDALRRSIASRTLTADDVAAARVGDASFAGELGSLVDRPRDEIGRALVAEVLARWQRFDDVVRSVAIEVDPTASSRLASTAGVDTFTGFNVSIDALLASDRDDVIEDVSRSADRFDHLALALLVMAAGAAILSATGIAQRMREYR